MVEGLGRVVLDVREPCAEDIPALQNVRQLELILLCRFQRGIPTDFGISAAQVGDGILHCPIVGVYFVAAQGKLPDQSGSGSITKVEGRIDIPLVPCRRAVMFCGKRSVQRELVTETLAESGIEIQGLLATTRLHVGGNCGAAHGGGVCIIIELVAMVDACGIDCTVVHLPAAPQVVLLGKEELPAVDALAIFGAESKFLALQDAVQLLAGGRAVVRHFGSGFQSEGSAIVQPGIVQPVAAAATGVGPLGAEDVHQAVVGRVVSVIDQTQLMRLAPVVVRSGAEAVGVRTAPPRLVGGDVVGGTVCLGVQGVLVGQGISPAVGV